MNTRFRLVEFGDFQVDLESGELSKKGVRLRFLPDRALSLFKSLAAENGSFVSRDTLFQSLSLDHCADAKHALDAAIADLRRMIGDSATKSKYIETVPRRGYRLRVPVNFVMETGSLRADKTGPLVAVGQFDVSTSQVSECKSTYDASVELITSLRRHGLRAVADTKSNGSVSYSLSGQANVTGGRAKVSMRAEGRGSGGTGHSFEFEALVERNRPLIACLAAEIAIRVRGIVDEKSDSEAASLGERFLKEAGHHWKRRTREGFLKAIECYALAAEHLHEDSRPFEGLSVVYLLLAMYGIEDPKAVLSKFRRATRLAIRNGGYAPDLLINRAHALHVFNANYGMAERLLLKALAATPRAYLAHHALSMLYTSQGRFEEALEAIQSAAEIDPLWPTLDAVQAFTHFCRRDFAQAIQAGSRSVAMHPYQHLGRTYLAQALEASGRLAEAMEQHTMACQFSADVPWLVALRASCMAKLGQRELAIQELRDLDLRSPEVYVDPYYRAVLCDALGLRDEAIRSLERAVSGHSATTFILAVDPKLDSLRSDPRFGAILAQKFGPGGRRSANSRWSWHAQHVAAKH